MIKGVNKEQYLVSTYKRNKIYIPFLVHIFGWYVFPGIKRMTVNHANIRGHNARDWLESSILIDQLGLH